MLGQSLLAQSLLATAYPEALNIQMPESMQVADFSSQLASQLPSYTPQLPPMWPPQDIGQPEQFAFGLHLPSGLPASQVPKEGFAQTGNTQPSKLSEPYEPFILEASQAHGVPPEIIRSVIMRESSFNPKSYSSAKAMGLMQLIPETAKMLGVTDPWDPRQNIMGGTKYLADLNKQFGGKWDLTFAAYNAGPGAVRKYGGVPPYAETKTYVKRLMWDIGYR